MVHILVNVNDLYILGGSVHTIKKYAKAFVVACKDNGLELNADKTKYMVMSRDEGAGRSNSLKLDNRSFEMVNQFKYKGNSLNDRNFIITFFKCVLIEIVGVLFFNIVLLRNTLGPPFQKLADSL